MLAGILEGRTRQAWSIVFFAYETQIASGSSADKTARCSNTGATLATLEHHAENVPSVAFSLDKGARCFWLG